MLIKIKYFFLIVLISSLASSADPINKWKPGWGQNNPSTPFELVDPQSKLVTDPAYHVMDPISALLADPPFNAKDPESIKIVSVLDEVFTVSETTRVNTGSQPKATHKTTESKRESLDSMGNTVTKTYEIKEEVVTVPIITTTTKTTTKTTTYADGSVTNEIVGRDTTTKTVEKIIERIPKGEKLISTKVTANPKDTWSTSKEGKKVTTREPTVSTTWVDEKVESIDENGSTVIDTYRISTDTITTPTFVTTTTTTTEHTLWTDGKTTTKDTTTSKDSLLFSAVSTKTRKEYKGRKVIPNIISTNDSHETTTETFKGTPIIIDSDCTIKEKRHRDSNKNIIIKIFEICKKTATTPITTVKTTTYKRNILWTDESITSEVIDTHTEESTVNIATTYVTEEKFVRTKTIKFRKLNPEDSQKELENYLKDAGLILDKLSESDLKNLAVARCKKLKVQGIEYAFIARFHDEKWNWNKKSGFEKLYDLIDKCLKD